MDLNPLDLDLTERLKRHDFAVEYVLALEEEQRAAMARIAELETTMRSLADTVARVGHDGRLLPSEKRIAFQCAQHVRNAMARLNIATKD